MEPVPSLALAPSLPLLPATAVFGVPNQVGARQGTMRLADVDGEGGLPRSSTEFRLEMLRRLDLLNREIQALDIVQAPQHRLTAVSTLRSMEGEIRERLRVEFDGRARATSRALIITLWKQYRRTFEVLAAQCRQTYPARAGQRDRGPRW